jgi:hypothetical protein
VYADHFIAFHLSEMPLGCVYSKLGKGALAAIGEKRRAG